MAEEVYYIDGSTGQPKAAPKPKPKVPTSASEAMQMRPEEVPSFTVVMATVDNYMSRLPWWVVAGAAAGATWYVLRKR